MSTKDENIVKFGRNMKNLSNHRILLEMIVKTILEIMLMKDRFSSQVVTGFKISFRESCVEFGGSNHDESNVYKYGCENQTII